MDARSVALAWYDHGVVPVACWPGSKKAAVKWERWQTETPPRPTVAKCFDAPRNLGLLCGGSLGLVVLDFDDLHLYERWRAKSGALAGTYTVSTARGVHVYFEVDQVPKRSVAFPGLDVKCTGYVIGAGSTHPSGVRYQVTNAPARILEIDDLVEVLPKWERALTTYEGERRQERKARIQVHQIRGLAHPGRGLFRGAAALARERVPLLDLVMRWTWPYSSDGGLGRWWMARCPHPAHEDRHPSFRVDADHGQACCLVRDCTLYEPRGMDAIELYSRMVDVDTRSAIACLLDLVL
jgi:hypothetical protein